jgi:hypothetical protein
MLTKTTIEVSGIEIKEIVREWVANNLPQPLRTDDVIFMYGAVNGPVNDMTFFVEDEVS